MSREHLKFVVVGSVDHGKSTLIGRFLYDTGSLPDAQLEIIRKLSARGDGQIEFAFVLDHLEEERANRITIDTAQTFFSSEKRDYVIIDAPGHKEFLKNMITGASQASAAMLLLDVHEGLREQTRRHAYILSLLGIKQLIIVLNKMDLVGYGQDVFDDKAEQIEQLLAKVELDRLAVIPTAALAGDNIVNRSGHMGWYSGPTVIEALDLLTADVADESLPLRIPVQDVYDIQGRAVAVGRVASGQITAGQVARVCPAGVDVTVDTLEKFEGPIQSAVAGESIGFVVSGDSKLRRGLTLAPVGCEPKSSNTLTASVFWMAPEPLKPGDKLAIRLATQEVACTVERIANRMDSGSLQIVDDQADQLAETEVAEVTFATATAISYDRFTEIPEMGRLVLMRGNDVVAGGIVP